MAFKMVTENKENGRQISQAIVDPGEWDWEEAPSKKETKTEVMKKTGAQETSTKSKSLTGLMEKYGIKVETSDNEKSGDEKENKLVIKNGVKIVPDKSSSNDMHNLKEPSQNVIKTENTKIQPIKSETKNPSSYFSQTKMYDCSVCTKSFKSVFMFNNHNRKHHKKSKLLDCTQCGKVFKNNSTLLIHEKTHSDIKPFICDLCGRGFREKGQVTTHVNLIHKGLKPFNCDQCGVAFAYKYQLKVHMLKYHPESAESLECKTFLCSQCSRTFNYKSCLKKHIAHAHEEKTYKSCEKCHKKITTLQLKKHKMLCLLSEEERLQKLVTCTFCGKYLSDVFKVKQHIEAVHTKEKRYQCHNCDYKNYRRDNMRGHIKRCHAVTDVDLFFSTILEDGSIDANHLIK